jgi:hypothetical protein
VTLDDLAEILEAAASKARELAAQDRANRSQWIDQAGSPLGPRRHHTAVRRRLAKGLGGAAKVGRKSLLSPDALAEELSGLTTGAPKAGATPPDDGPAALARSLGITGYRAK